MEKVIEVKQFSLKVNDFLKGVYIAVIVPILVTILETIQSGSFDINFKSIGLIAVSSLAAYLLKNFFQSDKVIVIDANKGTASRVKMAIGKDEDDIGVHPPSNPIHPIHPTRP